MASPPARAFEPAKLTVGPPANQVVAEPGTWTTLPSADPLEYAERCAGLVNPLPVALEADVLPGAAHRRARAGLAVVTGHLPDVRSLRVLDVVLLGIREEQPPLWQTVLGRTAIRALRQDQAAAARALAGRTGLAAWVDRPAQNLSAAVTVLTDLTRALAGAPRAVIWCRPEWLDEQEQHNVTDVLEQEQAVRGFPVLELTTAADVEAVQPSTLPGP